MKKEKTSKNICSCGNPCHPNIPCEEAYPSHIDKQLDEIYDAVDLLMKGGCWNVLDEILLSYSIKIWRTDLDILLGYLTATLPGKNKLKRRTYLLEECKRLCRASEDTWKGLE